MPRWLAPTMNVASLKEAEACGEICYKIGWGESSVLFSTRVPWKAVAEASASRRPRAGVCSIHSSAAGMLVSVCREASGILLHETLLCVCRCHCAPSWSVTVALSVIPVSVNRVPLLASRAPRPGQSRCFCRRRTRAYPSPLALTPLRYDTMALRDTVLHATFSPRDRYCMLYHTWYMPCNMLYATLTYHVMYNVCHAACNISFHSVW